MTTHPDTQAPNTTQRWYSPKEACALLILSASRLRELSGEGGPIPCERTKGGHRRYSQEHIDIALANRERGWLPIQAPATEAPAGQSVDTEAAIRAERARQRVRQMVQVVIVNRGQIDEWATPLPMREARDQDELDELCAAIRAYYTSEKQALAEARTRMAQQYRLMADQLTENARLRAAHAHKVRRGRIVIAASGFVLCALATLTLPFLTVPITATLVASWVAYESFMHAREPQKRIVPAETEWKDIDKRVDVAKRLLGLAEQARLTS